MSKAVPGRAVSKGRVLVTGGAGFIGSHVVDELLLQGYEPHVVDNLSSGRRENLPATVPLYEADIRDGEALRAIFTEVRPEAVIHLAAQVSVSRSMREPGLDAHVNILGWVHVLEECARRGIEHVIFASSGGVLYGDVSKPADEDHPVRPVSPYGISKWVGEQYLHFFAREHGLHGVALRYANVYGPRQDPHGEAGVVAIFSRKMLAGEPATIFGDGKNVRDYVFVGDVARATVRALGLKASEGFAALNIGTGIGTDVNELESRLRALVAKARNEAGHLEPVPPPRYGEPRPGDLCSSLLSPGRAHELMDWTPRVSLEQGLLPTVRWFTGQVLYEKVS